MEIIRGKIKSAQKVVIYGPEGIGKSTFASKFPNPIFIDTEGSTKHMDVARTAKPQSFTMLLEQIRYIKTSRQFETLIIDTADWAESLCTEHICAKTQKTSIEDFGYGKGYTYLEEEFGRMLNLLEEVVENRINIVITAHSQLKKFEQPHELGAYDRYELKLEKKTAPLLKEWADIILFANYKTYVVNVDNQGAQKGKNKASGGKRVMYTSHHPCWDAKNRHDLAPELPFEYEAISHCIPVFSQVTNEEQLQVKTEQSNTIEMAVEQLSKIVDEDVTSDFHNDLDSVPKALAELMKENSVSLTQIQKVVAQKGYYPMDTPIEKYDKAFIDGVLIGAWQQVYEEIKKQND